MFEQQQRLSSQVTMPASTQLPLKPTALAPGGASAEHRPKEMNTGDASPEPTTDGSSSPQGPETISVQPKIVTLLSASKVRELVDRHINEELEMPWVPEDARCAAVDAVAKALEKKLETLVSTTVTEGFVQAFLFNRKRARRAVAQATAERELKGGSAAPTGAAAPASGGTASGAVSRTGDGASGDDLTGVENDSGSAAANTPGGQARNPHSK